MQTTQLLYHAHQQGGLQWFSIPPEVSFSSAYMEGLGNRQIVCNMKPGLLIYVVKLQTLTSTVGLKCPAWTGRASRLSTSVSRDLSGSFRIVD